MRLARSVGCGLFRAVREYICVASHPKRPFATRTAASLELDFFRINRDSRRRLDVLPIVIDYVDDSDEAVVEIIEPKLRGLMRRLRIFTAPLGRSWAL